MIDGWSSIVRDDEDDDVATQWKVLYNKVGTFVQTNRILTLASFH